MLAFLAALPLAITATPVELDFPALARETLELAGYDAAVQESLDIEGFLEGPAFLRCQLGAIELRIPVGLADEKTWVKQIAHCATGILDMQSHWLAWVMVEGEELEAAQDDLELAAKWVKSWSSRQLSKVDASEGLDLAEALGAKDKTRAALARLSELFVSDRVGGLKPVTDERARIILAANRESFVRTLAVGGLLSAFERPQLWDSGAIKAMAAWLGPSQVVAMEFVSFPVDPQNPYAGFSMDDHNKTRQLQHVVDRAAATLLRRYLRAHEFHFFESALAANLVLATVGENDLAMGGQSKDYSRPGSKTPPFERFVPGGNPAGGTLPARGGGNRGSTGSAKDVPRWFRERGRGYYVKALREAQKEGAKFASRADSGVPVEARRLKQAHFEVSSRESGKEAVVSAPFFGAIGKDKKLPEHEFLDDYEEFFGCYRTAFLHWIRTEAGGEDGPRLFAQFLQGYVAGGRTLDVEALVEQVYEAPISAGDADANSLEWRFLDWVSSQR